MLHPSPSKQQPGWECFPGGLCHRRFICISLLHCLHFALYHLSAPKGRSSLKYTLGCTILLLTDRVSFAHRTPPGPGFTSGKSKAALFLQDKGIWCSETSPFVFRAPSSSHLYQQFMPPWTPLSHLNKPALINFVG